MQRGVQNTKPDFARNNS